MPAIDQSPCQPVAPPPATQLAVGGSSAASLRLAEELAQLPDSAAALPAVLSKQVPPESWRLLLAL
jgi:hypothetical protein